MTREILDFLQDILEAIEDMETFTQNLDSKSFYHHITPLDFPSRQLLGQNLGLLRK